MQATYATTPKIKIVLFILSDHDMKILKQKKSKVLEEGIKWAVSWIDID